ncbi:MAG: hypothetical protein ACXAC7_09960 [Candidatus Hodarchaeales archaeon]|jgi:hypothetical protein
MATLRRPNNLPRISEQKINIGTKIKDLLSLLHYKETEIPMLQIFVNGIREDLNYVLNNNDKVYITIPIGGG